MRMPSDFNQTQQLNNDFKNATSSLGNVSNYISSGHNHNNKNMMMENEAHYQSDGQKDGPLSMGRKSKSSLKSTQNLNFQGLTSTLQKPEEKKG